MKRVVEYAHNFMLEYLQDEDITVDFTMGNGYDTLFLAKHSSKVYAFDIQVEAISHTREKLIEENIDNVELILDGHEHVDKYVSGFKAGIFNFGYLPHGKQFLPTVLSTSKIAVEKALSLLEVHGFLCLVLYPGHLEGQEESEYFMDFTRKLDSYYFDCFCLKMTNKKDSPYIICIEKKQNY